MEPTIRGVSDPATGLVEIQVPTKRIARLIQLGRHVERAEKLKQARRRMQRMARRRNRRSK